MPAETLNCPKCGAPASTDATLCEHCGARLATVACPSCFGMVFVGAKFCSHCGAKVDRTEVPAAVTQLCPRCRVDMNAVAIGGTHLRECPRCEGIWADAAALQQICDDREKQAAVLGMPAEVQPPEGWTPDEQIHYLPCPVCRQMMNRVNFAHCSHVIVNVCKPHGTWFDKDALRRIVEFIRAGGLEKARAQEIAELKEERNQATAAMIAGESGSGSVSMDWTPDDRHLGVSIAAGVLRGLLGL
jgi:Zn-finger nucleic acid-binding protein